MSLHDEIKAKARKALEAFIKSGMSSKEALKKVQNQYVDDVVEVMAGEINSLKVGTITPTKLKKMAVGDIDLSTNLYRHIDDVNANVLRTINEHAKELQSAQKLALKIYEGYDFQKDLIDVKKALPKYLFDPLKQMSAKQLKTPALKAAYLQTLNANNEHQLKKALEVAMYERNRFFANRIAQTELHRIRTAAKVKGVMEDDGIEVIQIRLSASHPKVDICDYHANLDAYGLGKGCYPKDKAPLPPYHPFCQCMSAPRVDLSLSDAKPIPDDPEKTLMRQFDEVDQVNILGTKGMLEKWKRGGKVVDIVDRTKKPLYRTKYSGELPKALVPDLNGDEMIDEKRLFNPDDLNDTEKQSLLHWTMSSNGFKFNIAKNKGYEFHLKESQLDPDELLITREGHQEAFEGLFSKYNGDNSDTLYRGVVIQSSDSDFAKSFDNLKVGDVVKDSLPNSYSKSYDKGVHFANLSNADAHRHVVYELKGANTGNRFNIETLSDLPEEKEVLVSGIRYKVTRIEEREYTDRWGDIDKYTHVTIEEVE